MKQSVLYLQFYAILKNKALFLASVFKNDQVTYNFTIIRALDANRGRSAASKIENDMVGKGEWIFRDSLREISD